FLAGVRGDPGKTYVYGIDPASEIDKFSIVILELGKEHRKIVYCWTTNKEEHRERIKRGFVTEDNFYAYCARKIRELMKVFTCERIALDSQGGGHYVMECLRDTDKMEEGEVPIHEIITDKRKESDDWVGLHIVELISFVSAEWTSNANHALRKDLEDRV